MKSNTKRISRGAARAVTQHPHHPIELRDFEQLAGETLQIEHQTIPGYLRRIPHKWHLNDITRFGDQVGRVAEAMQLAYITASEKSLGTIRVFPLPLLHRVYQIMAPSFNWPIITDADPALEDGSRARREELKAHERADADLIRLAERTDDVETLASIQAVRDHLAKEINKIRLELDGVAGGVTSAV